MKSRDPASGRTERVAVMTKGAPARGSRSEPRGRDRPADEFTALVLAGGLGTRIRGVLGDLPKCLAPVHERAFVSYLLDDLAAAGCRECVLCTGVGGDRVEAALGATHGRMRLVYSREPSPLGTGGALRLALDRVGTPFVLALNGDSLVRGGIGALATAAAAARWAAAILLVRVDDTARYGRVEVGFTSSNRGSHDGAVAGPAAPGSPNSPGLSPGEASWRESPPDPDARAMPASGGLRPAVGAVRAFTEKSDAVGPGWINAGGYWFARDLLARVIPPGRPVSLEREVLPRLAGDGLVGIGWDGAFIDIGTPASLAAAETWLAAAGRHGVSA